MNKVKTFGAVPWYDREIDANDREVPTSRDSREYVTMRKVLEDLRFRLDALHPNAKLEVTRRRASPATWRWPSAARRCLYEGTFRKYHANDPDRKPWTADESEMYLAAPDAYETLMGEGNMRWFPILAKVATQYRSLFTVRERLRRGHLGAPTTLRSTPPISSIPIS